MNKITSKDDNFQKKDFDFFSFDYDEEKKLTSVHFQMPLHIQFYRQPSGEEIYRQLAEHFRISISTLAKFISVESVEMLMQYSDCNLQVQNTAATFQQIADYIDSYTTLLERLESRRPEILEIKLESLKSPENSSYLAEQIAAIMNNPDLPESLYNAIADEMAQTPQADNYTTESVLRNLQNLRDQ